MTIEELKERILKGYFYTIKQIGYDLIPDTERKLILQTGHGGVLQFIDICIEGGIPIDDIADSISVHTDEGEHNIKNVTVIKKKNMKVKLISITEAEVFNEEGKRLSPEQLIVFTARVSNPSNQLNTGTSDKLLAYLIKNKHWSPFEMVDMTVEIVTSRAIAQQILRHRSFSFQEFSQRYAEATAFEPVQLRKAGTTNRQSSSEVFDPILDTITEIDETYSYAASIAIKNHIEDAEFLYKELISKGVAKECARMVLPLTTQTTIYMKGSIRSWIHYLQIRCDEHTQLEHREIANAIREIFNENFPNIAKALEDGNPN